MNIVRGNIRTFPDLSFFTREELHFNHNTVRVVPDECLPRGLKVLDLKYNSIASDGLPAIFPDTIERLELDGNRIRDFRDVQQFPSNLRYLSLSENLLHSLEDLYRIISLETLNVGRTNLESISLLPQSLIQLIASKCYRLRMLPNRFPSTLRSAVLNDCSLRYASLPGHWGCLEELNVAHNDIEQFPRNLPSSLKILNLTGNKLRFIPENFNQKFPLLEICLLSSNKLRTIPVAPRFQKLILIDLSNNILIESVENKNRSIGSQWSHTILEDENWTTENHRLMALRIQKNVRIAICRRRLRTWKRTQDIKDELMCISMMPGRAWETDVISSEWRRS